MIYCHQQMQRVSHWNRVKQTLDENISQELIPHSNCIQFLEQDLKQRAVQTFVATLWSRTRIGNSMEQSPSQAGSQSAS